MFASRLKSLRNQRKLSQEELAKKINTTKGTISNYENRHSTPSNELLRDLANILNTTTDYLLGRTDNPEPFNKEVSESTNNDYEDIDPELQDFIDNVRVWYKDEPESKEEKLKMFKKMFEAFKED